MNHDEHEEPRILNWVDVAWVILHSRSPGLFGELLVAKHILSTALARHSLPHRPQSQYWTTAPDASLMPKALTKSTSQHHAR